MDPIITADLARIRDEADREEAGWQACRAHRADLGLPPDAEAAGVDCASAACRRGCPLLP